MPQHDGIVVDVDAVNGSFTIKQGIDAEQKKQMYIIIEMNEGEQLPDLNSTLRVTTQSFINRENVSTINGETFPTYRTRERDTMTIEVMLP